MPEFGEYSCKMNGDADNYKGLLVSTFLFLMTKLVLCILILLGSGTRAIKIANVACTFLAWLLLVACWALFVDTALKHFEHFNPYGAWPEWQVDFDDGPNKQYTLLPFVDFGAGKFSPGPGLGCAVSVWVFLFFSMAFAIASAVMTTASGNGTAKEVKTPQLTVSNPGTDIAAKVEDLKRLLDNGILTQEEYDRKKAEILDRL